MKKLRAYWIRKKSTYHSV